MTQRRFSEVDTEVFYDSEDSLYRSFWDSEGSLHWGYFENLKDAKVEDFITACQHWNEYMLSGGGITKDSRVLDLGCGNGNTAVWLCQQTDCEVVGVDLSGVRIENAKAKAQEYPSLRLEFEKASATNLPYEEGSFTHAWSQATLYHVHDRHQALREVHRVLEEGGTFIFDDLISPTQEINEMARQYVYDRLIFEPTFSMEAYADFLTQLGFMVLAKMDLSEHLHKSYELLSQLAKPQYPELSCAYDKMCEAISAEQLGWGFFLAEKVSDRLSWIYGTNNKQSLRDKYDAWSCLYDAELDQPYRISPIRSAKALAGFLPDKEASILDAGAGTGMVGEALAELGYSNITAVDLSEEMLAVARKKKVYRSLHQGNLEETLKFADSKNFDAIVTVGVFTFNHAPIEALYNLFPLLKAGGYFLLTVRADYHDDNPTVQEIIKSFAWSLVAREEFNIFDTEAMYAMVWKKD